MRVGGQPAPELCCCSLCLAVGRLSVFCHSGELGPGALGFATDRVRILYNELLDIRARAPPPPRPGGVIGVPPPVAEGVGGPGTNPGGGSDLGVAAPEGPLGGETSAPLSTPGAEVKTEQTEPEVPPPDPVKGKSPPESKGEQRESAPPVAPKAGALTPQPPPPPPHWPLSTEEEAPAANSKATSRGVAPAPPPPSVTGAKGVVPVKAAPRLPASEAASSSAPKATEGINKGPREEDEYTYESCEEEAVEEDPEVDKRETKSPVKAEASAPEPLEENRKKEARSEEKRSTEEKQRRSRERSRDRRDRRRTSRGRSKTRSRRRGDRRSRREESERGGRRRRGEARPVSPPGPPPAHLVGQGKGSGKTHPVWKKSKGKVRDARWKDIQQFGPNKRRKKRREEGQR